MKRINLSNFGLQGVAPLSRDEMRGIVGGDMPPDGELADCECPDGNNPCPEGTKQCSVLKMDNVWKYSCDAGAWSEC